MPAETGVFEEVAGFSFDIVFAGNVLRDVEATVVLAAGLIVDILCLKALSLAVVSLAIHDCEVNTDGLVSTGLNLGAAEFFLYLDSVKVSETEMILLHGALEVLVVDWGHDGLLWVHGVTFGAEVGSHHRVEVKRQAAVSHVVLLLKCLVEEMLPVRFDVLEVNIDVLATVPAQFFVRHAKKMEDVVECRVDQRASGESDTWVLCLTVDDSCAFLLSWHEVDFLLVVVAHAVIYFGVLLDFLEFDAARQGLLNQRGHGQEGVQVDIRDGGMLAPLDFRGSSPVDLALGRGVSKTPLSSLGINACR